MAAPSLVGSDYSIAFSSVSSVELTITDGFTAGNSVLIPFVQEQGTIRAVTGITLDGANFQLVVAQDKQGGSTGSAHLYADMNVGTVAASSVLTLTFNGNTVGRLGAQDITPATNPDITDTGETTVTGSTHRCGDTGLTTDGDVLLFAVGTLNNTVSTITPGTDYTRIITGGSIRRIFQYRRSDSPITTPDQGLWTTTGTARTCKGCMAAFYAASAGGGGARRLLGQSFRLAGIGGLVG